MTGVPGAGGPRAGHPAARGRTLGEVYRRFGGSDAAGTSPLHGRVAVALGRSGEALHALEAVPARRRHPAVVLAALHDLALAGRAPALAAAYAAGDGDAAAGAAVGTLLTMTDAVAATAARRRPRTSEPDRCAVLYPAVAEAARRAGADAVGLVAVAASAGLDVHVDRVGITYGHRTDGGGRSLGDPSSPVQLSCSVVGDRPVPARPVPDVAARIGVDPDPVDLTDPEDARWLRACLPPDRPERAAALAAAAALVAAEPPVLLRGDAVDLLPEAVARVPAGALPVVTTAWALARLPPERRLRFLHRLDDAAAGRAVVWVSVEGVGVAPGVPTLGDRRASGHSTLGLTPAGRSTGQAEAVGRCWSRGRLLAWLADPAG
ncbi:DUF2332 domain-containing protein [Geodermatophilus sp. SYSU D00758]